MRTSTPHYFLSSMSSPLPISLHLFIRQWLPADNTANLFTTPPHHFQELPHSTCVPTPARYAMPTTMQQGEGILLQHLDSTSSSSYLSTDSKPSLAQFNLWFQTLHGPRNPGTPLLDNPIPAHTLHDLTYIRMATTTMVDKIIALTGNRHLYNTMASLQPIPDKAFFLIPTTPAL
ncbi:hypothetical protein J3A83DRAFT_4374995 [Scleroderma citrinum]